MAGQFGSQFASRFSSCVFENGAWSSPEIGPVDKLNLHPAAHVLHYSSSCFEGLKAYRHSDGKVRIFRLDRHIARFQNSARILSLPQPDTQQLAQMIRELINAISDEVPDPPAALYLRPVLIGTDPNIGNAAHPSSNALLYVLASPVGQYFTKGEKALRLWIEDQHMRSTPAFGQVKTGGNYACALGHVIKARQKHAADQVLFCPGGDVQETGAANFLLLNDKAILTKRLDGSILPGVTRASLIELATDAGYQVEERDFGLEEMFAWAKTGEAALSGTAAVLAGVGTLVHGSGEYTVGNGQVGSNTQRLRALLTGVQRGTEADKYGWLTEV